MKENKIYFTKNDIWRAVGVVFIIAGQFSHRTEYTLFDQTFATSELTLVGISIAIIMPLLMRKWGTSENG